MTHFTGFYRILPLAVTKITRNIKILGTIRSPFLSI